MNTRRLNPSILAFVALPFAIAITPRADAAGFFMSGPADRTAGGHTYLRIPESGLNGGIWHDLTPGEWYSFRVRVTHSDSAFPNIGWTSDNFTPASSPFQVCNDTGCEVPEIDVGTETLDWNDFSKITFYLEAKDAPLSGWSSWEIADPE